jgi:hypothetical protein
MIAAAASIEYRASVSLLLFCISMFWVSSVWLGLTILTNVFAFKQTPGYYLKIGNNRFLPHRS